MVGTPFYNAEAEPLRTLTLYTPDGPAIGWMDLVEEDLKTMGVRNWRRKSQDLDQWRAIVEDTKVHCGL
jgi:hypothetical protein